MANVYDLVRQSIASTGTGNLTLGGNIPGFSGVEDSMPDATPAHYLITSGNDKEIGIGQRSGAGTWVRTSPQITIVSGVRHDSTPAPISVQPGSELAIVSSADLLGFTQAMNQEVTTTSSVVFNAVELPEGDIQGQILGLKTIEQVTGISPTLDIDFTAIKEGIHSSTHSLPPEVNVTRASNTATRVNALGLIETVAANTLRLDYDPLTLKPKGVLIEEGRPNFCNWSEEFDQTAWLKLDLSVNPNMVAAPDGQLSADKFVENLDINTVHYSFQSVPGLVTNTDYAASVFLRAAERSRVRLAVLDSASNGAFIDLDLSVGQVTGNGSINGGSLVQFNITPYRNDFYRAWVSATTITDTVSLQIELLDNLGNRQYNGDGTSGLYTWGAQLEQGSFATSYIPTASSQVTRVSDIITLDASGWFREDENSFLVSAVPFDNTETRWFFSVSDGTANNRYSFLGPVAGGDGNRIDVVTGGVFQGSIPVSTAVVPGQEVILSGAFRKNDASGIRNGGTLIKDNAFLMPENINLLSLGGDHTSSGGFNGNIKRLSCFPKRLADDKLEELVK